MCCRNFFRFTLIFSAFQILLGSSAMAEEVNSGVTASSEVESSNSQSVDSKETGNSKDDDDIIEISVSLEKSQPVKEIKLQISLDPANNSVDSDSLPSDGLFEQRMKEYVQEKKDTIVSKIQSLRSSLNKIYAGSDAEDRKFLELLKSCELRARIVGDNEKTLQIDLESPISVSETVLLEKTSLDEKNNRFVEINLINK